MPATVNSSPPTATHRAEMDAAFSPPARLTASTMLTHPAIAGTKYELDAATAQILTLPSGGSIPIGRTIVGHNIGAGAWSFAPSGGETIVGSGVLPATCAQYDPFEFRRITGNRWLRVA